MSVSEVIVSVLLLCVVLILLVKLLQSIVNSRANSCLEKGLNLEIRGRCSWVADYVLIFIGAVVTILVGGRSWPALLRRGCQSAAGRVGSVVV